MIAGAGGGYDVFSGLPLYFALKDRGANVYLASYSFSFAYYYRSIGRKLAPYLVQVDASSEGNEEYFPERYLSHWFKIQGKMEPIYCFEPCGVRPLTEAYRFLVNKHEIDRVILADGGSDSLLAGDEVGLGTPLEDMTSIAAVDQLDVGKKLLVSLGFGIDRHHGVCHADVLKTVADLTRTGGFLGAFSLLDTMPEVQRTRRAIEYVHSLMPKHQSVVCTSVLDAVAGHYGDHHSNPRTAGSVLFINPLMSMYWCFELTALARRIMYLEQMKETESPTEVRKIISEFRDKHDAIKEWTHLPI